MRPAARHVRPVLKLAPAQPARLLPTVQARAYARRQLEELQRRRGWQVDLVNDPKWLQPRLDRYPHFNVSISEFQTLMSIWLDVRKKAGTSHIPTLVSLVEMEPRLSPFNLHYIALVLFNSESDLFLQTLTTAAFLSYPPSILTLMHRIQYQQLAGFTRGTHGEDLHEIKQRLQPLFNNLVKTRNPDALVMQGLMGFFQRSREGTKIFQKSMEDAERVFRSATSSSNSPTVDFQWRATQLNFLGQWHLARGHQAAKESSPHISLGSTYEASSSSSGQSLIKAKECFRVSAMELDDPEGHFFYGRILDNEDPQKEESLYKAAEVLQNPGPSSALAKLMRWKATREANRSSSQMYDILARQWDQVARELTNIKP